MKYLTTLMIVLLALLPSSALAGKGNCEGQKTQKKSVTQASDYCTAAEAAEKAAKNQQFLMAVHGGVAGLCAVSCAIASTGYGAAAALACAGASIGAGATDIMMTKQFTGAASVLMGSYGIISQFNLGPKIMGALGLGSGAATGAATGAKGASNVSKAACVVTVLMEGAMAVMNGVGAQNSKKSAQKNYELAAQITENPTPTMPLAPPPPSTRGNPSGISSNVSEGASPGSTSTVADRPLNKDPSSQAKTALETMNGCTGGFSEKLHCAKAAGISIPAVALESHFIPALEALSGRPIDELMSNENPQSLIGNIVGNHLGENYSAAVQDALQQLESGLLSRPDSSSVLASAYSGSKSTDAQSQDSLNAQDSLLGNSKTDDFRKPASAIETDGIETDRSISLFERISRRYRISQNRLAHRGYTSPQNKILSH